MSKYAKFIVAMVTPIVMVLLARAAAWIGVDVTFDNDQVNQIVVAAVTAISVWAFPNAPA